MLTGDETGIMKAAEAASATVIAKGRGEAPIVSPTVRAIGAMSTAVAVFEMNSPSSAVTAKIPASAMRGLTSPMTPTSA